MAKSKQKANQAEATQDAKSVEFNQPEEEPKEQAEPGKPTENVNEGEPVIGTKDPEESYEDNLASIEKNTIEKSFTGPVYTEDPDEPNPIGMVSHICALCYLFPCKDHGINRRSHQPFPSSAMSNNYQVPPCRTKHNFLANFEPTPQINLSRPYGSEPAGNEKARQVAEAERDKAEMYVYNIREKLTYTMARMETVTRKFAEDNAENAAGLRAAIRDVLKTMKRDIVPDYKFDM